MVRGLNVALLLNYILFISYRQGDIAEIEVNVIVNAANESLLGEPSINTSQ